VGRLALGFALLVSCADAAPVIDARAVQDFIDLDLDQLARVKIVTATLRESDPFSLPFMALALTRADREERLPRALPGWLSGVAGVMIQKTANGQGSPFIRGFTGYHTLLLIDGIRLNNPVFRDGPNQYWNTVDANSVDRLEIVKGPGSVLYGSDAIGGTAHARTISRRPSDASAPISGLASYRFASAEDSHTVRAELGASLGDLAGLLVGATHKGFGDLRGGHDVGRQRGTGYDQHDYDAKLEFKLSRNARLVFAHQAVQQDEVARVHSTTNGLTWRGLSRGTDLARTLDQRRQLDYVQLHVTGLSGFAEEVHVSLSNHLQREGQYRLRSNRRAEVSTTGVETFGALVNLETPSRLGRWTYGGTLYRDWVDALTCRYNPDGTLMVREVQGPVADNSRYDLMGGFVQNQLPPIGPVDIGVRGRFEHAHAHAGRYRDPVTGGATSFENSWDSIVGSARASVRLDAQKRWRVFGGVGQGFRAPNLSDLTRMDIAASGQVEIPSTTVEPEHFMTYEAGVKGRHGRVDFQAAYFYTAIRDLIIRTPTGRKVGTADEVAKRNSGAGFVHGTELQGSLRLADRWTASASFTWMEGRVDVFPTANPALKVREPMSRVMPLTSQFLIRWAQPAQRLHVEASCTLASRQDKLSPNDRADIERIPPGGTPGYAVWTLRASWQVVKHLRLTAALENISDEDYRIHGSGINEPGRNLVLAGRVQF
jgi:hemoglobin/transferrin/lactoferrin receptor protein